jgi:hypothetical protein
MMPPVQVTGVPDIAIKRAIQDGVAALVANPGLLDAIWSQLAAEDITRLKAFWAEHPPTVLTGFARRTDPFPCFAVTLASDDLEQALIDDGEFLDTDLDGDNVLDEAGDEDTIQREVTRSAFRIWVFAENPDVCAAYYRVLRRILQVGKRRLESEGLNNPALSGSELAPDPAYTPDNLFTRQVTLTVIYEESWSVTDALAVALGPAREARLSADGELVVRHVDAGGGVEPVVFDDDE